MTEPRATTAPRAMPQVPVGDIQLYDDYVPVLYGGNYAITVTHDAPEVLTAQASATQRFTISAPQFAIDPAEIVQLYPPDGSTGQFDDVLPFVVLATPELPWERQMNSPGAPWLAVLVLGEDEITGGTGPARTTTTTVDAFLALAGVLVPPIKPEADVPGTQPCSYLQLPASTFTAITPRLAEARYLTHVRVVNTGDKALAGLRAGRQLLGGGREPLPGHRHGRSAGPHHRPPGVDRGAWPVAGRQPGVHPLWQPGQHGRLRYRGPAVAGQLDIPGAGRPGGELRWPRSRLAGERV